jgi:hypothetical protein
MVSMMTRGVNMGRHLHMGRYANEYSVPVCMEWARVDGLCGAMYAKQRRRRGVE